MQIVRLMGGFANQLMIYVYGRYLEYRTGEPVYYDDSRFFEIKQHNGYELERVYGLNLLLLSKYYPDVIFNKMVKDKRTVCQILYDEGVYIDIVRDKAIQDIPFTGRIIDYDKEIAFSSVNSNRYHWTYAPAYPEYYNEIKEVIDRELIFPPLSNEENRKIAHEICECNSVGVHIRLGDFERMGWLTSPEYYKRCIDWAENKLHPDKYYIFSNEMDYCQSHSEEYGFDLISNKICFIEENRGINDYVDFQLMSMCKHIIVAPYSTFSHCACVFNKNFKTKIDGYTIDMKAEEFFGWKRT